MQCKVPSRPTRGVGKRRPVAVVVSITQPWAWTFPAERKKRPARATLRTVRLQRVAGPQSGPRPLGDLVWLAMILAGFAIFPFYASAPCPTIPWSCRATTAVTGLTAVLFLPPHEGGCGMERPVSL